MEKPVVGTLIDSFGAFGQFNLGAYYVTCFGILPSSLKVDLDAETPKETVDATRSNWQFRRRTEWTSDLIVARIIGRVDPLVR